MLTINNLIESLGVDKEFFNEVIEEGGGVKLLGWEELNTEGNEYREDTLYDNDDVNTILLTLTTSITPYLLQPGTEQLVSVSIEECGLSIAIPPINQEGWLKINNFLRSVLREDFYSLDWDLCYSNGYTAGPWD